MNMPSGFLGAAVYGAVAGLIGFWLVKRVM
jgi:hypothetical protein